MRRIGYIIALLLLETLTPNLGFADTLLDLCSESQIMAMTDRLSEEQLRCQALQEQVTTQINKLNSLTKSLKSTTARKLTYSLKRKISATKSRLRAGQSRMKRPCLLAETRAKELATRVSDCGNKSDAGQPITQPPLPIPTATPLPSPTPTPEPTISRDLSGIICEYPAPPLGCHYEQGPSFNPATQCGLVLSCTPIRKFPPGPMACEYPAPPLGCEYVEGINYDSSTQCGLELKCDFSLRP